MFRLVRDCRVLACVLQPSTCLSCTPAVFGSASPSTTETFRQRKAIDSRVVTRSYNVGAIKANVPQVATETSSSASSSRKRPAASEAAPRKQCSSKAPAAKQVSAAAGTKDAMNAAIQPSKTVRAASKPAAAKKLPREKASTSSQTSTDTAELRKTADIEAAQPSHRAVDASPSTDMQPAPSGMPASIPSGLPADPAVLHCWTKDSLAEAAKYLAARDPALAPLIEQHGLPTRLLAKGFENMFNSLARNIVGQQLAVKAAKVISGRFLTLCQCEEVVTPAAVLAVTQEQLRAVGLSNAKARYVLHLASHFQSGQLSDAKIGTMDDATLIAELTKVKGIGQWTVDMFAMFHLGRPDIFPVGDLAVRRGLIHLYNLKVKPSVAEMDAIGDNWAPYRSLGSYYMWRLPIHQKPSNKKVASISDSEPSDTTPSPNVVSNHWRS